MSHAILSPSSAERWLNCTPSARLELEFPDKGSIYAAEGTLAHSIGELLIREKVGLITKAKLKKELQRIESLCADMYSESMLEYADDYATHVVECYNEALEHTPDAKLFLEQKLDMTEWVPEGFGTGDSVILADRWMNIIDLKYGKGVQVSAENNKQMMLYALGALSSYGFVYDIDQVRMTIFQPRIGNISTWDIPVIDLMLWAETELRERAELAFRGKGEFIPGKHCQFCKAKPVCKALADHNMQIAQFEFKSPSLLNDEQVAEILNDAKLISDWLSSVEDYALDQAVEHEKKWPGYKLVEGRSNRKYADEEKVVATLKKKGIAEDLIYNKKVKGITALEKEIGKNEFNSWLSNLLVKPPGKPTLVPESDKRPELSSAVSAAMDFS